jgi:predicted ATPase
LPKEVIDHIVDRTDGVPLFVEEMTKSVLESGLLREEADRYVLDGALSPFAIPTTLHASLLARLDRLASVRHVAQTGAAIGREFAYEVLRAVANLAENELHAALHRLIASELIFERGTPPDAVYTFKHALVQDAAHSSLRRSVRRQLHAQIAEALETHSPDLMDSQPELFAQHYAEAGLVEKSVAFWGRAGWRSTARSAMAEAAAQLKKGLDQLALVPDSPERRRRELEFCSALGAVLLAAKGLGAPETGQAYARARELWEQLGSPRNSSGLLMDSHSITCSAANWTARSLLPTTSCVSVVSVTTRPASFSVIYPPPAACCTAASSGKANRIWKPGLRSMIRPRTARLSIRRVPTRRYTSRRIWRWSFSV